MFRTPRTPEIILGCPAHWIHSTQFHFLMAQKLGPLLVLEWNRSVSSSSVLQFDLRLATPSKWLRELATFQAHPEYERHRRSVLLPE